MRGNKGFSLIELIIVITILAILTSGALVSLKYLTYADVDKATEKVNSALSKLQMETVSTGYPYRYLVIEWKASDKSYYMSDATSNIELTAANWSSTTKTITNKKRIASDEILITFSNEDDGSNPAELRDDNPLLLISYKPSSGAFLSLCKQIVFTGNGKASTLYMVHKTGNHYVE